MSSNLTPIPGHPRYRIDNQGHVVGPRGFMLRPHTVKGGYLRVTIDGCHRLVHVLVAETFIGPRPVGCQVNHMDGNKAHNAAVNLEYVTPSANVRHSIDVLGVQRAHGERNGQSRLTATDVIAMRAVHASGVPAAEVGRRFGVDPGHAWRVVTYRAWGHVA